MAFLDGGQRTARTALIACSTGRGGLIHFALDAGVNRLVDVAGGQIIVLHGPEARDVACEPVPSGRRKPWGVTKLADVRSTGGAAGGAD